MMLQSIVGIIAVALILFLMKKVGEMPDSVRNAETSSDPISASVEDKSEVKPENRKKKIPVYKVIIICLLGVSAFSYATCFHLSKNERAAYDLVIQHANLFKDPTSVYFISGSASPDGPYGKQAYLCVSATNSYGAKVKGYYLFLDNRVSDISKEANSQLYDLEMSFCKETNQLNSFRINNRIRLYWLLH